MSQIDWSKAPEGATHYHTANKGFYRFARGDSGFYGFGGFEPTGKRPDCFTAGTLIERPAAWNGEGLPPVGAVCEYKHVHEWQKVEVFAVKPNHNGSHTALFTYENGTWGGCAEPSVFRTIRTPEQIAAEVREKAVQKMLSAVNFTEASNREIFRQLYDLGYRKFEITEE